MGSRFRVNSITPRQGRADSYDGPLQSSTPRNPGERA